MTTEQNTESRVNYAFKIIGNLKHDNHLFDRTCPRCKGMYSSFERANCPKCNEALTYMTTKGGKPMAVSEGTIGLCFGPKQESDDDKSIKNRKNGLHPVYRFKRFAFADDNGALGVPIDHGRMKNGAQVELTIINHQLIPSGPFNTKEHGPSIEFMALIYDNKKFGRNDTLVVLRDAPAREANVPVQVGTNRQPLPVDTSDIAREIVALETRVAAMKAAAVSQVASAEAAAETVVQPSPEMMEAMAQMDDIPFDDTVVTDNTGVDPFEGAA